MNRRKITPWLLAAGLAGAVVAPAGADTQIDPRLPEYERVAGVSGTITTIGSDTMNNLATLWGEGFIEQYPGVGIEIEGMGSSTGPVALIEGTATFAPMSRAMTASEIDRFEDEFGYPPTVIPVAVDMLAVYVHRDNTIDGLTIQEVDAIFSGTQRGGHASVTNWGHFADGRNLPPSLRNRGISIYGRNAASGTYGYFREHALFGGDFRGSVREQPGSSSVVQGVANEINAIGYSGIGYKTADVRALPLKYAGDERFYQPTAADAGDYPLARFLYLYVNRQPGQELDPLRREFVRYIFSQQGQEVTLRDGYLPVSAEVAAATLESLGLEADFLEEEQEQGEQ
ncbi:MAG: phosphate ABC transporter substrate-binding protein [Phycisphaeraceae bacterium]